MDKLKELLVRYQALQLELDAAYNAMTDDQRGNNEVAAAVSNIEDGVYELMCAVTFASETDEDVG